MRSHTSSFIGGLIIGAVILWAVAVMVHMPGAKTNRPNSDQTITTPISHGPHSTNQVATSTHSLPGDFPGNVPVYKPSTLVLATRATENGKATYNADFTTTNRMDTLVSYYGQYLSTYGWHINSENTSGQTTAIEAANGNELVSVTISQLPGSSEGSQASFHLHVIPA